MSKKPIDVSRRKFLVGAGGFTLGLPFMHSLLPKEAWAQSTFVARPRLAWMTTDHGGALETNMFPSQSLLTQQTDVYPGHTVRAGELAPTRDGTDNVLSPILRANASVFTNALISKMNVLQGLDVPFYIGHNTGGHLGNFAANTSTYPIDPRPTIDQILAWSSSFYRDPSSIRARVINVTPIGGTSITLQMAWSWSNPGMHSGTIQPLDGYNSSLALFRDLFTPASTTTPQRGPVVDRILDSYNSLRTGNSRLSAADRRRLDDHVDGLAELEQRLHAPVSISCGNVPVPTDDAQHYGTTDPSSRTTHAQLFNAVIAAAFKCGASRIAIHAIGPTNGWVSVPDSSWHPDYAHHFSDANIQPVMAQSYQRMFEGAFLDLAARLDVEEAPGQTYLDNTLLAWTQESGMETHVSLSTPVVTFGKAAGYLHTGQFCDYRQLNATRSQQPDPINGITRYPGLLYNQWLATAVMAMGLAPSEFELWGYHGVGFPYLNDPSAGQFIAYLRNYYLATNSMYFQDASQPLPFLHG